MSEKVEIVTVNGTSIVSCHSDSDDIKSVSSYRSDVSSGLGLSAQRIRIGSPSVASTKDELYDEFDSLSPPSRIGFIRVSFYFLSTKIASANSALQTQNCLLL